MNEITNDDFLIRPYNKGEEHKRAALANACRTSEKDPIVTIDMIRREWEDSRLRLESDTWVALNKEGDYISVAEVWFDDPDNDEAVITRHIGFEMHPAYRQQHGDLMDKLLHEAIQHASTRPFSYSNQGYVLRIWASATDSWKRISGKSIFTGGQVMGQERGVGRCGLVKGLGLRGCWAGRAGARSRSRRGGRPGSGRRRGTGRSGAASSSEPPAWS